MAETLGFPVPLPQRFRPLSITCPRFLTTCGAAWRRISWRLGSKGPLAAEFAALRVRPAEGAQLRDGWHLPGDEVWLLGEHRASGERKYYLSNLPAATPLEELAATIKARWVCEPAHQQTAGCASRRTSRRRRSSASTISRAAPGPVCTGTR